MDHSLFKQEMDNPEYQDTFNYNAAINAVRQSIHFKNTPDRPYGYLNILIVCEELTELMDALIAQDITSILEELADNYFSILYLIEVFHLNPDILTIQQTKSTLIAQSSSSEKQYVFHQLCVLHNQCCKWLRKRNNELEIQNTVLEMPNIISYIQKQYNISDQMLYKAFNIKLQREINRTKPTNK